MRLIDADALERDGWRMSRIVQIDEKTMEAQTRKPTDFPTIEPERIRGRWVYGEDEHGIDGYHCNKCGFFAPWDYTHKFIDFIKDYHFCPHCGADMREDTDHGTN